MAPIVPAGALPPAVTARGWSEWGRNTHRLHRKPPPCLYLLLHNSLRRLQKALSWDSRGSVEEGGWGLVWTGPPREALQCAAGCVLRGVWKDVSGQGGGCWDPCLVWGLLEEGLAVVCFTRGVGGGRECRAGGTCMYRLCWVSQQNVAVSALKSAEPPPSCS